ncbi:MAG: DUF3391 domain-containing protein [Gammaproteobacteria bacterium]|nr:DUF3391 domain-containing protein [Gammaproteobacteria bacterium]
MLFRRIAVEANEVMVGMYVAALDRPWLETPFLFQGFEIEDDDQRGQLAKYCDVVYVDLEQSSLAESKIRACAKRKSTPLTKTDRSAKRKLTPLRRVLLGFSKIDPTGIASRVMSSTSRTNRNTVKFKQEQPRAAKAHKMAMTQVSTILDKVESGEALDSEKLRQVVVPLVDSIERNEDSMAWLAYLRKYDEYTYSRALATSVWAVILGRQLGMDRSDLEDLGLGGLLLDVGKSKMPNKILKKAGRLRPEEFEIMKTHVHESLQIARADSRVNQNVLNMIEFHHARFDGTGYPTDAAGQEIPLFGRIAALVDCYDAITTKRTYAPAMSPYDAIRELQDLASEAFQEELVEQFVHAIGMFPTGSVVELNNGAVGIVLEQNRVRRLRPKLLMVLDVKKRPLKKHKTIDLRKLPGDTKNPRAIWIERGHDPATFGINPNDYFL